MTQQPSISRLRPVIRVFVSSTFSDLKHERDALQRDVFPKLEQFCASRQFQFQAIDLRWGISSEAGDDHRTMRICFDELRRSQEISPEPNFLILLGNRYGMRPLPEEISQAEYEQLAAAAQFGGEHRAPIPGTHGKTALQVLRDWYRCDENVLLPVPPKTAFDDAPLNYVLQPRTQDLHDGRDYTRTNQKQRAYSQDWRDVQQVLRRIIDVAFPVESLDHRFDHIDWPRHVASVHDRPDPKTVVPQIVRFQASATEQEIWSGALSVPNAERHVLAFFRDITNRDGFAPEEARDFYDLTETKGFDEAAAKRQNALRKAIVERLGKDATLPVPYSRLKRESGRVVVDASEADTRAFCDAVFERFRPIVERQIDAYWRNTAPASADRAARDLEIEQREYARFAEERGGETSFVGRQVELRAILDYVRNDSRWPLVIHGASGCGKTALLARASQEVAKTRSRIERFIGVAPRSSDLRSLLSSLCQQLRQRNPRPDSLPTEIKELRDEFSQHLQAATPEQPLILFLDALDQLADAENGRLLDWLPLGSLPPHVKLVASCLSDRANADPAGQPYAELKRRPIPAEHFIDLDALSEAEARLLLFDRWLAKAGRTVSDDQRARIERPLASPACRQPIYLKLLFDEVQLWRSYDPPAVLGESVSALLGQLFDRVSQPTNHGPLLVNRALGYLSASRYGLAENEILEILFADPEYWAKLNGASEQTRHALPPNAKRIPIALWSRLRFDLAPYLTERAAPGANVLTFYHRQVAEWVRDHLGLTGERPRGAWESTVQSWKAHPRLAKYFTACAKGAAPQKEWETDSVRGFSECVFHLVNAELYDQAAELLTNFPFVLHKLRVGLLGSAFEDYDLVRLDAAVGSPDLEFPTLPNVADQLTIWADFFREKAHILRRGNSEWPAHKILLQLAVEHADDSPLTIGADRWLAAGGCDWLWLRRAGGRQSHFETGPCLRTFEGHRGPVLGAHILDDRRILSWGYDGTLRLWDEKSGALMLTLEAHTKEVLGVSVLPNGQLLSWGADRTVRYWDALNGELLRTINAPVDEIAGAQARDDGRMLSWSNDQTLRLWDWRNGALLHTLEGHTGTITGALMLNDGRILSWCGPSTDDKTLRLWDERTGELLRVFEGHLTGPTGSHALPDGKILSWGMDATLRFWDTEKGTSLRTIWMHTEEGWRYNWMQLGALILVDGRILTWSDDLKLRLWDSSSGEVLSVMGGETEAFDGALVLKETRILSWSQDGTLHLWDHRAHALLGALHGHTGQVGGARAYGDGRVLSWSDDGTARLWDSDKFAGGEKARGHTRYVYGARALGDGRTLSWARDNTMRLWDEQTGALLNTLDGYSGLHMPILHNGVLICWSEDGTLRALDGKSGRLLHTLEGHTGTVWGVCALDCARILSWSEDGTLRIWDLRGGQLLHTLEGHGDMVIGAQVLSDGRILSWSPHREIRLWDGFRGECLGTVDGCEPLEGAQVLPDGRILLLSWTGGDELWVWDPGRGSRLEQVSRDELVMDYPSVDIHPARGVDHTLCGPHSVHSSGGFLELLRLGYQDQALACWHANCPCWAQHLLPEGIIIAVQDDYQVCILHVHEGNRRQTLAGVKSAPPTRTPFPYQRSVGQIPVADLLLEPIPAPPKIRLRVSLARLIPSFRTCSVMDGNDYERCYDVAKLRQHLRRQAVAKSHQPVNPEVSTAAEISWGGRCELVAGKAHPGQEGHRGDCQEWTGEEETSGQTSDLRSMRPLGREAVELAYVRRMLAEGRVVEVLGQIRGGADEVPEVRNAYAVCLMRQGNLEGAVRCLRRLVLPDDVMSIDTDIPDKYKLNFATALLLEGNFDGCRNALVALQDPAHPIAAKLRATESRWLKKLTVRQRLAFWLGTMPEVPIELDFPPGEV